MNKALSLLLAIAALFSVTDRAQAKATATAFYSEHFDTGLPGGWTTGVFNGPGATWKWYSNGQVSTVNPVAAINTTTGFMIFDGDSIGAAVNPYFANGWLKSPVISCTGHSHVGVTFNEYYRKLMDSCFVDVSINNFTTYTRYFVSANWNASINWYVDNNPYAPVIDISAVAANQANVQIRFSYSASQTVVYSWQIDDVQLVDLDPASVALHGAFLLKGNGISTVKTEPLQLTDSISPYVRLNNVGYNAQAGFTVNAKIFQNAAQVYNQAITVTSLPVNAFDSFVRFPAYTPGATGDYIVAYSLSVPGNVNTQITDTARFTISDTTWYLNENDSAYSLYLHKPTPNERSNSLATQFVVTKSGAADTITSIEVAFHNSTTPGTSVGVQVYKYDPVGQTWTPIAVTYSHTLTAGDISPLNAVNYVYFPIDTTQTGPIIIDSGQWAAVVVPDAVASGSTLSLLCSSPDPAGQYTWASSLQDTALNDATLFTFGGFATLYSNNEIPLMRMNFGSYLTPPVPSSVWPGDVNFDHVVDNNDALDLALGFGNTGVTRPGATNSYTAQPCTDWGTAIVTGIDMKNADCDGNGTVGYSDTVAIYNNYGLTHPKGVHTAQPKASGLPDLYFDLTAITFNAGTTVHIPIKLGTATSPMNNVMGFASQIKVSGIILANNPRVTYTTSWMGNTGNLLNFTKAVNSNQTDWAFTRIDNSNVSGSGTIATLDVDIPLNANGHAVFYFDNVKMIDNANNVITGFNLLDDTAQIVPVTVANVNGPAHALTIVPNPSTSYSVLQINLEAAAPLHIMVSDITGKTVFEANLNGRPGPQQFELPGSQLAPGIYNVKVNSDQWPGPEVLKWIRQ